MISANRIEFRGYSSVDFDLKTCMAFESDSGEVSTYLTREAVASESYRGEYKRIHNFKYTETFNPKFTFVKDGFGDFEVDEVRKVLRWLTGSHNASFLTVYKDDSNVVHFEILGGFSEVSLHKLGNGRVVAITAVFESAYPYALSPLRTIPKNVSDPSNNSITIDIDTDEPESAVYPKITIRHNGTNYIRIADGTVLNIHSEMIDNTDYFNGTTHYWRTVGSTKVNSTTKPDYDWIVKEVDHAYGDGDTWETGYIYQYGTNYYWLDPHTFHSSTTNPNLQTTSVKITNTYADDNEITHVAKCRVANNTLNETIVLDGANKVVSSSRTSRIFGDDFIDWEWLPLYNGNNEITIEGNCNVSLEYREVRKVGEL